MKKNISYKLLACSILLASNLNALAGEEHNNTNKASGHAPAGVMGDHLHKKGEFMVSYRYARMQMEGNRKDSDKISTNDVFAEGFMVAPLNMSMDMHMLGAMYGLTDSVTLMAMLPYKKVKMDHITKMGKKFTTSAEGLGDAKLAAMFKLHEGHSFNSHVTAGLSLPTGDVDKRDDTPAMLNAKLPYPMQLGSGTYNPFFAITGVYNLGKFNIGGQLNANFKLGRNSEEYRLGNEYSATAWASYDVSNNLSSSIRIEGLSKGDISGDDDELNPNMVPTARTDFKGGERVDLSLGLNFLPKEALWGTRVALEYTTPIYQNYNGMQMGVDNKIMVALQQRF